MSATNGFILLFNYATENFVIEPSDLFAGHNFAAMNAIVSRGMTGIAWRKTREELEDIKKKLSEK